MKYSHYDVFPEFAPPQVVIQTEAPGLSPEQVEQLVTRPIENAINGVPGTESLRSGSIQGLSVITVTFDPNIDIYRARQMISERLSSTAGQLPGGIEVPAMTPLTSSTSVVMVLGLTSDSHNLMDIRAVADWTVKQSLLAVPGVSKVAVFGGEPREIQIQVNPERLMAYNISLEDIASAASQATGVRGAGFIENNNQRIVLQTEGQTSLATVIAKTVVKHTPHGNVMLKDVAIVVDAPEPLIGAASIMGQEGVQLVISAQYGANTLEVTRSLDQALNELSLSLKADGITLHTNIFRPADFIVTSLRNIRSSLILGAILVAIVLILFLLNLRAAAISITAIPLSLVAAVTALEYFGYSLNTMTLGGLAIAIGLVVDDAIIDVENVFRRIRENRNRKHERPILEVILDASIEVRSSIVFATVAIALVFVPVLTMSGVTGRLFAPLGIAFIFAILASLVVALTVTPALCYLLLANHELREPKWTDWLKEQYKAVLLRVENSPRTVLISVALFTVGGFAMLPFFGGNLLPELREGHFIVHMSAVPGTSLEESKRLGIQVTKALLAIPSVRAVSQRIGRAEAGDDILGSQDSEFDVDLRPMSAIDAESVQGKIRGVLTQFPGVNFSVMTFLSERVEETVSGYTATVVVRLFGNDLDVLDKKALKTAQALSTVAGATDVQVQSPQGSPQLTIHLRPDDVTFWGLRPTEVLDVIRTSFEGDIVGQIYEGNRVTNVAVVLDPEHRKVSDVGALPLKNSSGTTILLHQVADIFQSSGRYAVLHEGARRVQAVTCNVAGRDVNSFVAEARKKILELVKFPTGTYVQFGGEAEAQNRSRRDLLVHSLATGLGIILLLSMVVGRMRNLLLIFVNLPLALVGGVIAVFGGGGLLSIGSLVGFVTLFGITLRNSILMVSHYEHLVIAEGQPWELETAVRGAKERLAPILMTSLVTALGLLPLAIGSGDPGREIEGPMAIVILGGLLSSTVLNLLVLPTLSLKFGRFCKTDS